MRTRYFFLALAMTATMAPALPVSAQDVPQPRSERPYHGLFAPPPTDADQSLTLSLSGGGGAERGAPLISADGASTDQQFGAKLWRDGTSALGSGQLRYVLDRERVDVGASADMWSQYYGHNHGGMMSSEAGAVAMSVSPFKTTLVTLSEAAVHQPYTLVGLMPGLFDPALGTAVLADQGLAADRTPYTSTTATAAVTQAIRLGRRDSVSLDYSYQRTNVSSSLLLHDWQSQWAGATYHHGISRDLGFHVGYHYRTYTYPQGDHSRFDQHDIDAGVDLNHAFSVTRLTKLTVSSGTAAYTTDGVTRYDVTGSAKLTREIGRTWTLFGGYGRNVQFIDTLGVPVRYDTVQGGINGMVTRSLKFDFNVRASLGDIGFTTADNSYRTGAAGATLTKGLKRWLAIAGSYTYYRYSLDSATYVPSGAFLDMDRQVARVYVTVWTPLFEHHPRRANAAR